MQLFSVPFSEWWKIIEERLNDKIKAIESLILNAEKTFDEINKLKARRAELLEVINLPDTIKKELEARLQDKE